MHNPELRGIDQILTVADNGAYAPQMRADLDKLVQELRDFSLAFGGGEGQGQVQAGNRDDD